MESKCATRESESEGAGGITAKGRLRGSPEACTLPDIHTFHYCTHCVYYTDTLLHVLYLILPTLTVAYSLSQHAIVPSPSPTANRARSKRHLNSSIRGLTMTHQPSIYLPRNLCPKPEEEESSGTGHA